MATAEGTERQARRQRDKAVVRVQVPGRGAGGERQCVKSACILASWEDDREAEAGITPPGLCGEHDEPSAEAHREPHARHRHDRLSPQAAFLSLPILSSLSLLAEDDRMIAGQTGCREPPGQ